MTGQMLQKAVGSSREECEVLIEGEERTILEIEDFIHT